MGSRRREQQLTFLYGIGACLSLATIICIAVPWNHWEEILDTCLSSRCGCILNGIQLFHNFSGGDITICYFTTFASIPAFIVAIVMAIYHGYRVCMFDDEEDRTTRRRPRRQGEVAVITPSSKKAAAGNPGWICWTVLAILVCCIGILILTCAIFLTDGYYSTCSQYRKGLSKNSQTSGQMAAAISIRLSCGAIFDFMDYLEPVTRPYQRKDYVNYNYPHEEKDYQRGPFINTGASLQIALTSAWINCAVWLAILVFNSLLAYSEGWCCKTR